MIFQLDELLRVLNYIKENGSSELVKLSIFDKSGEIHLDDVFRLNIEEYMGDSHAGGNLWSCPLYQDLPDLPF